MNERLYTVKEVAEHFKTTPATVLRWIKTGKLHGVMPGGQRTGYRIPSGEVERLERGAP